MTKGRHKVTPDATRLVSNGLAFGALEKPRVTLDANAVIDLDPETPAPATREERRRPLQELAEAHRRGQIALCVPAVIASERQPGKAYLANFADFQKRLARCGLQEAKVLPTVGRYGIAYEDWFVYGDDERGMDLERKIHDILFPQIAYEYGDFAAARGIALTEALDPDWRNPRCDVLGAWSHIWYGCDVFVTADKVFHNPVKGAALIALGAKAIVRPQDAMGALRAFSLGG